METEQKQKTRLGRNKWPAIFKGLQPGDCVLVTQSYVNTYAAVYRHNSTNPDKLKITRHKHGAQVWKPLNLKP